MTEKKELKEPREVVFLLFTDLDTCDVIFGCLERLFDLVPGYEAGIVVPRGKINVAELMEKISPKITIIDADCSFRTNNGTVDSRQIIREIKQAEPSMWFVKMSGNGALPAVEQAKGLGASSGDIRMMAFKKLEGSSFCGSIAIQMAVKNFLDAMDIPHKIPSVS